MRLDTDNVTQQIFSAVLVGILCFAPVSGRAEGPIVVEADSVEYERDGNVVHATGNVEVGWEESILRAGDVLVEQDKRSVAAKGGIRFVSPDLIVDAGSIDLQIDDELGVFEDIEVSLTDQPGKFGGVRAEKLEGRRFRLDEAYFTTCDVADGKVPDWAVRGDSLKIELDGYGELRNGALEVKGVPVIYLPYAVFPTKYTRQSGLLMPTVGSSNRRGFMFSQPLFWAIDKHRDATVTLNLESSARVGVTGAYRYRSSLRRRGGMRGSYFNEKVRGDAESQIDSPLFIGSDIPENRGYGEFWHRETLEGSTDRSGVQFFVDAQLVSDDLYLREVDSSALGDADGETRRSQRFTQSRIGGIGYRKNLSGGIKAEGFQDLVGAEDTTLQRPMAGWMAADGEAMGFGWNVRVDADAVNRDIGVDGQRLDGSLGLDVPTVWAGPVAVRSWVNGRASAYNINGRAEGETRFGDDATRAVFDAGVDARAKLRRSFASRRNDGPGIVHSLEPFVALRSTNTTGDEVPLFDRLDSIDGRDVATIGVDSRFLVPGDEGESSFELARLSLSQSYNASERVLSDHFSDVDLAGFVRPFEKISFRALASYNFGENLLTGAQASVAYDTGPTAWLPGPRTQVALAYRFVRGEVLESAEGMALVGIHRNVSLGLQARYDLESESFVEQGGGIRLGSDCNCWTVDLGVVERVNPDELQFRIMVDLTGLTSLGRSATGNPSPALQGLSYGDTGFWRPGW